MASSPKITERDGWLHDERGNRNSIAYYGWLNAALGISWFLWVLGRSMKLRIQKTPAEARAWLDEHFPTPPAGETK